MGEESKELKEKEREREKKKIEETFIMEGKKGEGSGGVERMR